MSQKPPVPFPHIYGGEADAQEHFLTPSVRYLEIEGELFETEYLSRAEQRLREYCRSEKPSADEFHTLKTGGSRFVFRLTQVEADEYEEAYSYILYVDIGAVMQYASYLNAVFFAVLTVLTVLVCLFGWRLGGYVERAHESQNWFFQNVSHELKTPMMAVQGCAEGIHTGVLEPVEASGVILEENERMSSLIEELLALSKLEAGQIKADFHSSDVRELLYDCMRSTETLAKQKSLRIIPHFDSRPVLVSCDEIQLRRVLQTSSPTLCAMPKRKSKLSVRRKTEEPSSVSVTTARAFRPSCCRISSTASSAPERTEQGSVLPSQGR